MNISRMVLALGLLIATNAFAEEPTVPTVMPNDGWSVTAGTAYVYTPAFVGSKDKYSLLIPFIRVNYKDQFFASREEGVGYNFISNEKWRIGPIAKWEAARSDKDSDGDFRVGGKKSTALIGLDKVDGTLELGGFAEYTLMDHVKPYVELRQGVNGHEGLRADVKLSYENQIGYVRYNFGPRFSWTSSKYNDAYFTIDSPEASRSGLATYDAHAGILTYGFGGRVIVPFSKEVAAVVMAGYDHLGDEPGDSSLVKERGSRHQVTSILALVYRKAF